MPLVSGFFFKAMIQAVLLFGADTWLVTPPHGQVPGGVSDPDGNTADGTATAEDNGRDVEIHLGGSGKGGDRVLHDGGIRQAAPKHGFTVYCYAITVRPMGGVVKISWGVGWDAVVGTGGN